MALAYGYTPHTPGEIESMLREIGVSSIEELFAAIPPELRAEEWNLPAGQSEFEVGEQMRSLAAKNSQDMTLFLGGGFYDHHIPAVVNSLTSRGEFFTSYTPYQPEVSQGTLQALYEYQTAICELTGMDVANASLYDGGTALAEGILMALRVNKKRTKVIIDRGVNPLYRDIVCTYFSGLDYSLDEVDIKDFATDRKELESRLDEQTAVLVVQNPNFFGTIADYSDLFALARSRGILSVLSVYPLSLGLLKSPGEMGADIVTGEGQSLGLPLSFGGPYLGIIAARQDYVRQLPGRIVGETVDREGRRGFVLTLQAREQHIRREKATSNICSNQGLCALSALIYLSAVGKRGLKEVARLNYDKAAYARSVIGALPQVKIANPLCFNEFVVELPRDAETVATALARQGILAGVPLGQFYPGMEKHLLVAVTEKRSRQEIDRFARLLDEAVRG